MASESSISSTRDKLKRDIKKGRFDINKTGMLEDLGLDDVFVANIDKYTKNIDGYTFMSKIFIPLMNRGFVSIYLIDILMSYCGRLGKYEHPDNYMSDVFGDLLVKASNVCYGISWNGYFDALKYMFEVYDGCIMGSYNRTLLEFSLIHIQNTKVLRLVFDYRHKTHHGKLYTEDLLIKWGTDMKKLELLIEYFDVDVSDKCGYGRGLLEDLLLRRRYNYPIKFELFDVVYEITSEYLLVTHLNDDRCITQQFESIGEITNKHLILGGHGTKSAI